MELYVIYVSNYKKRVLLIIGTLAILTAAILTAVAILKNVLICSITIDNYLSFSYPLSYHVRDIYINQNVKDASIETEFSLKKPVKRISDFRPVSGGLSFNYPAKFDLSRTESGGTDLLYHIDYIDNNNKMFGFIQVWSHPCPIQEFIHKSLKSTDLGYEKSSVKNIKVNTLPGYCWDYSVLAGNNRYYKGCEVFLLKNDMLYRISCFTEKSIWNKHKFNKFIGIVNSFKAY